MKSALPPVISTSTSISAPSNPMTAQLRTFANLRHLPSPKYFLCIMLKGMEKVKAADRLGPTPNQGPGGSRLAEQGTGPGPRLTDRQAAGEPDRLATESCCDPRESGVRVACPAHPEVIFPG